MFLGIKEYQTKPPAGVMLNPSHPLSRGLVGYWLFNEGSGSAAHDISGHRNNGTLVGMSSRAWNSGWGGSKFGGGLGFDGNGDYVENDTISIDGQKGSFFLWINRTFEDTSTGWNTTFEVWADGNNKIGIYYHSNNDKWVFQWKAAGTEYGNTNITPSLIPKHTWTQVGMTWDTIADEVKVYINGIQEGATDTNLGNFSGAINNVHIGADMVSSVFFQGWIDSVQIHAHALSAAEVKQLYNYPFCNLLRIPIRYRPGLGATGLSIPVAMNYYRRRRIV